MLNNTSEEFKAFFLLNFTKVYPSEFESLKNATQYKGLYENLPQKELYQVDFGDGSELSLTTIIDVEERKVVTIYGVMLIAMG